MEIAKFVFTCICSFVTVFGFFLGFWLRYKAKVSEEIAQEKEETAEKIAGVRKFAEQQIKEIRESMKSNHDVVEKKIEKLEMTIAQLQFTITTDFGQRLSSIEGEMKGFGNILRQIQNWFIDNTPKGK